MQGRVHNFFFKGRGITMSLVVTPLKRKGRRSECPSEMPTSDGSEDYRDSFYTFSLRSHNATCRQSSVGSTQRQPSWLHGRAPHHLASLRGICTEPLEVIQSNYIFRTRQVRSHRSYLAPVFCLHLSYYCTMSPRNNAASGLD